MVTREPEKVSNDADPGEIRYVNLYESQAKIYTRSISGFYTRIRRYTGIPLIIGFLLLPWLVIDGRPAVLFDIPARQFHVLWLTFWPQDFMLLAWALIIAAFTLFTVTVLVGRVWCGFTCPQTVWTLIFMKVEHWCEGDRNRRIKLDQQPWNLEKIARKGSKHVIWVLIAFITGATFVGYFLPIRELLMGLIPARTDTGMLYFPAPPAAVFWTGFFTAATYLNAGWMREQVCKYMCPYARFQSVMYDRDTLAVHYDAGRGEQRGPRKPKDDYKAKGLGDCTDCSWCVQVCPVDIDIRDGLQSECINCGLCVDACNSVMDKMSYPRGLIRFTSEDELSSGRTRFFRPRLFAYLLVVMAMLAVFSYTIATRHPAGLDILRDRGARMYRLSGDEILNVYTIKINNMDSRAHTFVLSIESELPFEVKNYQPVAVESGEVFTLPLRIGLPRAQLTGAQTPLLLNIVAQDDDKVQASSKTVFIGPSDE